MIRMVLADDDALLRSSLTILLDAEPDMEVVAAVGDGARAVAATRSLAPDLVLLDVRMPGVDGIDAARALRRDPPSPPPVVVMLTMVDEESAVRSALELGVHGYLLKDASPESLLEQIRRAARGERVLGADTLAQVIRGYLGNPRQDPRAPRAGARGVAQSGALGGLTPREREVLDLIAEGLSNAEIQQQLYISRGTLKTHISALLRKTGSRDRSALIVLAHRQEHRGD